VAESPEDVWARLERYYGRVKKASRLREALENRDELSGDEMHGDRRAAETGRFRRPSALLRRARADSLVRNSLLIMATTVVTSGLGYVFWLVAARSMSADVVGLGAALTATMTLIGVVACLGIGPALIHTLPKQTSDRGWSVSFDAGVISATSISFVGAVAALVFLPFVSPHFQALRTAPYGITFVLGTVLGTLCLATDYVFVAQRRAGRVLVRNLVTAGLRVVLILAAVVAGAASAAAILSSWTAAFGVGLVAAAVLLFRRQHRHVMASGAEIVRHAWEMRWHVIWQQVIGFGGNFPPYVLPLIVTARLSAAENAYFYTAWMVGSVFFIISPAVSQALFAEGSHAPSSVRDKTKRAAAVVALFLGPCVVVFLIGGGNLILGSFGLEYRAHASILLELLVLSAIPDAATNLYVSVCRVTGRLREAAALNTSMAVGALIMTWVLLPHVGIVAVGWSWLTMQGLGTLYVVISLSSRRTRRAIFVHAGVAS
jgi:O-antigen/teichoic acid export membrane protein